MTPSVSCCSSSCKSQWKQSILKICRTGSCRSALVSCCSISSAGSCSLACTLRVHKLMGSAVKFSESLTSTSSPASISEPPLSDTFHGIIHMYIYILRHANNHTRDIHMHRCCGVFAIKHATARICCLRALRCLNHFHDVCCSLFRYRMAHVRTLTSTRHRYHYVLSILLVRIGVMPNMISQIAAHLPLD